MLTHILLLFSTGEHCCRVCCYSTPFVTVVAVAITIVGMVGYAGSSVYGLLAMSMTEPLFQQ